MEVIWAKTNGEKETKVSLIVLVFLKFVDLVQNFQTWKDTFQFNWNIVMWNISIYIKLAFFFLSREVWVIGESAYEQCARLY